MNFARIALGVAIGMVLDYTAAASVSVSDVTAQQRYPWNGLVDVAFTITGTAGTKYEASLKALDVENNEALPMKTVYKSDGSTASANEKLLPGTYHWVWNAQSDVEPDWLRSTGCLSTSSKIVFTNQNLSAVTDFSAIWCGTYITDKTKRINGSWVKVDGVGREVQFIAMDGENAEYTKCVCAHFEQQGNDIVGYIKWAKYVTGDSTGKDFNAISANSQTIATSETEEGYGLRNVAIKTSSYKKAFVCDRVTVDVSAKASEGLYMVIDLSAGSSATSYPVSYLDAVPSGGWTDTYKTTKLVLRRIEPGSYREANTRTVTLTTQYWIGIFEVTQKQYVQVVGSNPAYKLKADKLPAIDTSYNDATKFLTQLTGKTGVTFDLPTEAQWEYACRAGTTSAYNNGGSSESDLKKLGRYNGNYNDGKSEHLLYYYSIYLADVGQYQPNGWGLYDMHGNAQEWVHDWYGALGTASVIDPTGPTSGGYPIEYRVLRGGAACYSATYCSSSSRQKGEPTSNCMWYYERSTDVSYGFRAKCVIK